MASWSFRKRISIAPGVTLNLGKKSASVRIGVPGLGVTVGTAGKRVSASLPGTGLSVTHKLGKSRRNEGRDATVAPRRARRPWGWLLLVYIIASLVWWRVVQLHWPPTW